MYIYTDAVVADLKDKLAARQISASVTSTSSGSRHLDKADGDTYPSVSVNTDMKMAANLSAYSVINAQGETVLRNYDANAYPFMWGFSFSVAARSEEEAERIAQVICDAYRGGVTLRVPSRIDTSESIPVFVRTDDSKIERGDFVQENSQAGVFETIYSLSISTHPYLTPKPLLVSSDYLQEVKTNPDYQLELLHVLLAASEASSRASHAAGVFKEQFGYVINPKPGMFSSLLNGSGELKRMRQAYQNGLFVDKVEFEKRFVDAVEFCPNLYDRAMRREPMESILEAIRDAGKGAEPSQRQLFNALGIPERGEKLSGKPYSPRDTRALRFYVETMQANAGMTVYQAIKAHLLELQESDERSEAIANAVVGAVAAKAVDSFTKPRQSGTGGAGKRESKPDKPSKPDLIGSSACVIGKKNKSCNSLQCPVWNECARGR